MRIIVGCDHAGFKETEGLVYHLKQMFPDDTITWLGTHHNVSCDYPDYAHGVCRIILGVGADFGILVCGTGIGMSMVANRYNGIRAALCVNGEMAKMSREHNDANVLCLGARVIGGEDDFNNGSCVSGFDPPLYIVQTFLTTQFEGGRHQRRIDKIERS